LDLFVYGTLTDDHLVREITGRRFARESAVLEGFERRKPKGGYPFIVPCAGGRVEGSLLLDVDEQSLVRFDAYEDEGRLYRRTEVVVQVGDQERRCSTYVGIPGVGGGCSPGAVA
jgi:gamma-glutamylcyclotransferase (GGCT)/AIG2-like uncharacterized protein YtfP